jgi:arginine/lysine/ornithine decarboxylase
LFLLTPAESAEKLARLVAMLAQFEQHIDRAGSAPGWSPGCQTRYSRRYRHRCPAWSAAAYTRAKSAENLARLVAMLAQFEQHIEADSPLAEVLPTIYNKYPVRYRDYTIRQLCQEMHDLYVLFELGQHRHQSRQFFRAFRRRQQEQNRVEIALLRHNAVFAQVVRQDGRRDAKLGIVAAIGIDARRGRETVAGVFDSDYRQRTSLL